MAGNAQILLRSDTAANWTAANPVLASKEIGYDKTNNKLKVGDGVTAWNTLAYVTASGGGGGSSYTVVNKTAGYTETITTGEIVIEANLAAGFTIVLPTAVGNTATIHIKKMLSAGLITVDGAGAETIDGGLTAVLNNLGEAITLKSNNANWDIV